MLVCKGEGERVFVMRGGVRPRPPCVVHKKDNATLTEQVQGQRLLREILKTQNFIPRVPLRFKFGAYDEDVGTIRVSPPQLEICGDSLCFVTGKFV